MAAQRIRAANSSGLPRCKSEGTLIDLSEGFSETSFNDVKGELLGTGLWLREKTGICQGLRDPRTLLLQGCQVPVQIIKSELCKLRRITDSALEPLPLVLFGFVGVLGGCFELTP